MDIFDEFLGKKPALSGAVKGATIFDEFLGTAPATTAVAPKKPEKLGDPGFTADMQPVGTSENLPGSKRGLSRAIAGVRDLPANYVAAATKRVLEGKALASEGLDEISQGKAATGLGKAVMGVASMPLGLYGAITDVLVKDPIANVTGSDDIGEKAALLAGGAIPIVPSANAVKRALPKNRAFQTLVEKIEPQNIPTVVAELKSNPRLALMDVSPAAKQMAQQLVVTEGKHLNHLSNVVEQRLGSAKGAVGDIYDSSLGTPVNVVEKLKEFKDNIKKVGQQQINPVVTAAKPVDISDVVAAIDAKLKPGANSVISSGQLPDTAVNKHLLQVRNLMTNDKAVMTSAERLHELQSVFRREAENLKNSPNPMDRRIGYALNEVRQDLVAAIDKAADGKYKPALKAYRDENQIEEAFHIGTNVISNSKKLENRPEYFNEWKKGATTHEIEAAREGARIAIDTQIRTAKNAARSGTDIVMPEFSAAKLKDLFGEAEANQMIKLLRDEQRIAQTNADLFRNSQTAMRSSVNKSIELPKPSDMVSGLIPPAAIEVGSVMTGGAPLVGSLAYGGLKLAGKGNDVIKTKLAQERNFQLSKLVSAGDGPLRDKLIQELEAVYAAKPSMLRRTSNAISKVIGP